jgi:hypothetical protein
LEQERSAFVNQINSASNGSLGVVDFHIVPEAIDFAFGENQVPEAIHFELYCKKTTDIGWLEDARGSRLKKVRTGYRLAEIPRIKAICQPNESVFFDGVVVFGRSKSGLAVLSWEPSIVTEANEAHPRHGR